MTVEVVTFGCRLNAYESEVMRSHAQNAQGDRPGQVILFNTCAVTAEAERQARQAIRRAHKENPEATIIVTGCSAQVNAASYAAMPEVSRVLGNQEKLNAESYGVPVFGEGDEERVRVNDIMEVRETAAHLVGGFEGRVRAFVQVQNGCNHRCTFCIIPFGRGNSRSVPLGDIVAQTRLLVEQGYKELVITGVDITDYGKDLPGAPTLGQMLRRLLALVPELPRLRISSIDPVEVDADLWKLIAEEPRLMPHLHISLQAGDDMVLKRMKRRHLRRDVIDFCARARDLRPDVAFGADIIAGFPTETEEMFANTHRLVEEADLAYLHVFPYSSRTGTPAARMPQVAKELRKERAARLRAAGSLQLNRYLSRFVGREVEGLVEQTDLARSAHYADIRLAAPMEIGTLVPLRVSTVENGKLLAASV